MKIRKNMDCRLYRIWYNMKSRCYRQNHNKYKLYGGRGITVCDKWQAYEGFFEDMAAGYEDSLTLDRIDNDKGYAPDNCRWATQKEQQNNRRNNIMIFDGAEYISLAEYARRTNTPYTTLYSRIKRNS